eukprot:scaffold3762_cov118-Isochrysis_galbana.AAC.4
MSTAAPRWIEKMVPKAPVAMDRLLSSRGAVNHMPSWRIIPANLFSPPPPHAPPWARARRPCAPHPPTPTQTCHAAVPAQRARSDRRTPGGRWRQGSRWRRWQGGALHPRPAASSPWTHAAQGRCPRAASPRRLLERPTRARAPRAERAASRGQACDPGRRCRRRRPPRAPPERPARRQTAAFLPAVWPLGVCARMRAPPPVRTGSRSPSLQCRAAPGAARGARRRPRRRRTPATRARPGPPRPAAPQTPGSARPSRRPACGANAGRAGCRGGPGGERRKGG